MRTEFGKGSARRTRRAGRVPAILYGAGQDVVHLSLPAREFAAVLRKGGSNALLTVILDGKEQLALTKAVQRNPVTRVHEHVDLLIVRKGEKVAVDVPVVVTGDAAPETIVIIGSSTIPIEIPATSIPENIEVDVEGRVAGESINAADVPLPAGAALLAEPEAQVVGFLPAPTAEALETDLAEAEAEVGIRRDEGIAKAEERDAPELADGANDDADS